MTPEQNTSNQPSGAHTPLRKEKKRVGFHSSDQGERSYHYDPDESLHSPIASPRLAPGAQPQGAPDAHELSLALTRILSQEQEDQECQQRAQAEKQSPATPEHGPKRPRPALRRNTSYDVPEERQRANIAESLASERQIKSITDARQRADRLAVSLGSNSAPGSRRSSGDLNASFQPLIEGPSDDEDETAQKWKTLNERDGYELRQRLPTTNSDLHYQEAAENLVRSHTRKGKKEFFFREDHGTSSGTATPTLQQAYAHDYVPRPEKYRGGILSSLLKLYHDDKGGICSGQNTPSMPGTPVMSPRPSPRPSPPTSRPASVLGLPRSRPSSGLFSYHRPHNSTSSLALTELMKSSSMFAAPASTEISDHMAEKLKRDPIPSPPKKKDKIRITVHIAGIISRHRYLLKLCRALMMYGAPTHRLEEYMTMSSRVLEIESDFLYLPGCMIVSFDDSTTHTTEVKLVRVPQGIDLGKLRDVHNIYKDVVHDKIGVEEATKRLEDVMDRKDKFTTWFRVFMYGVASACVAPFAFQGRWIDLPIAFVLGCILGTLQLVLAPSNELYSHVFEVTAAVVTSFLARCFGSINNGQLFCFSALAQSSIALILPGYMVLCSSLELQSHNIVAGSVRMVHAMIYTLFLGYGITIGASLYGLMDKNATSATTCTAPLHRGWNFLFVPAFALCLCIVNQAKWKQTPVMTIMALAGFCVNSYSSNYFGGNGQISNTLGAFTVGILANLYSRTGKYVENAWLTFVEWWQFKVQPRFSRSRKGPSDAWSLPSLSDPESRPVTPDGPQRKPRSVGYSLAAAAMLPAIFVQVPSGLAAGGSLLAGITYANEITGNTTRVDTDANTGNLEGTAFNVLFKVIQVAIGISVGLFMSAWIVYPFGKRRSGLFSF